ncbi:hypothetical protein [Nocardia terpenica]|uniref:Uncharacterized protein n=1 Tax=Nocardia terpenica TaxID=455432 RepID=A0A291RY36_9NOCA|nr:hypothetical protein [Nocardia terpenica]ATL72501.1 hypothetical protein CRH09_39705 [Nocardia terpenica]
MVPELVRGCRDTEQAFREHLITSRAVLGTHPRWALEYELIDEPDAGYPSGDPEWFRDEEPEYIDDEEDYPL